MPPLKDAMKWLAHMLRIQEVADPNIGPEISYHDRGIGGIP
jgi:hypothetical protein